MQLRRLIEALPDEALYFVHVDSKVDITPFREAVSDERVRFLDHRIDVTWGSFRQVEYQIALLKAVRDSGESFDYLISMSGLDYPVWSKQRITDFFGAAGGREFIQGMDVSHQGETSDIYRHYRFLACQPWKYGSLGSKFRVSLREIVWALGFRKPLTFKAGGKEYRLHKGSSWWAITPQLAAYVLDVWEHNAEYVDYFRRSFGPDETFIQTLAFNHPDFRERCILSEGDFIDLEHLTPLTYIYYKPEIKILTAEDVDIVRESGKMFCRKVVTGRSDEFCRLLRESD